VTTVVVSAVACTTGCVAAVTGIGFGSIACEELPEGDVVDVDDLDEVDVVRAEVESVATEAPGFGFDGGKSSCEIAITTSERNRARKKRLSIQGTGS
jgi:hypothetical protein